MMVALKKISGKVGRGASNNSSDVKTVQTLLNRFTSQAGFSKLKEDGLFGPRTEAAMLDGSFEVEHCFLIPWNKSEARFHDTDEYYDYAYETWRLQLTWPGPPPEDIGWLGVVLPGREPAELANGWVGIDLEDDGVTEVRFLCHRPGESYLDLYLGQPGAAKQTWHGGIDLYRNLGLWDCGKWKS